MIALAVISALALLCGGAAVFAAGVFVGAKFAADLEDAFDEITSWSKQATPDPSTSA